MSSGYGIQRFVFQKSFQEGDEESVKETYDSLCIHDSFITFQNRYVHKLKEMCDDLSVPPLRETFHALIAKMDNRDK